MGRRSDSTHPALTRPRAILLDVGDTILAERRFDLEAGIAAVVSDAGRVRALASAFRAEIMACHARQAELLLAAWLREREPALAAASLVEVEDAIWARVVTLVPMPGVAPVLARLVADGVPVAAVSNAAFSGRVLRAELARHGLADSLRFVLSSADVGVRKPAAHIYELALGRLGARAGETWFVGDRVAEDVAGALAVGVQPILLAQREVTSDARVPVVRDWAAFATLYEAAR